VLEGRYRQGDLVRVHRSSDGEELEFVRVPGAGQPATVPV
jgi:hypothetical protein